MLYLFLFYVPGFAMDRKPSSGADPFDSMPSVPVRTLDLSGAELEKASSGPAPTAFQTGERPRASLTQSFTGSPSASPPLARTGSGRMPRPTPPQPSSGITSLQLSDGGSSASSSPASGVLAPRSSLRDGAPPPHPASKQPSVSSDFEDGALLTCSEMFSHCWDECCKCHCNCCFVDEETKRKRVREKLRRKQLHADGLIASLPSPLSTLEERLIPLDPHAPPSVAQRAADKRTKQALHEQGYASAPSPFTSAEAASVGVEHSVQSGLPDTSSQQTEKHRVMDQSLRQNGVLTRATAGAGGPP
jgi:hypothetical protein